MFKRFITNIVLIIILLITGKQNLSSSPSSCCSVRGGSVVVDAVNIISSTTGSTKNKNENSVKRKTTDDDEQKKLIQQDKETAAAPAWIAQKLLVHKQDEIHLKISKSLTYSSITSSASHLPSRQLELSDKCQQELRQIEAANITLPIADNATIFNITDSDVEKFCSTNIQRRTITCDYTELFNNSIAEFREACQNAGGVIDNFRMKIFFDDFTVAGGEPVTVVFNNVPSCIGPSCDRDEYIQYVQVFLDQQQNSSSVVYGYTVEFSGAAGCFRHGANKAGAIVLLLVGFVSVVGMLLI